MSPILEIVLSFIALTATASGKPFGGFGQEVDYEYEVEDSFEILSELDKSTYVEIPAEPALPRVHALPTGCSSHDFTGNSSAVHRAKGPQSASTAVINLTTFVPVAPYVSDGVTHFMSPSVYRTSVVFPPVNANIPTYATGTGTGFVFPTGTTGAYPTQPPKGPEQEYCNCTTTVTESIYITVPAKPNPWHGVSIQPAYYGTGSGFAVELLTGRATGFKTLRPLITGGFLFPQASGFPSIPTARVPASSELQLRKYPIGPTKVLEPELEPASRVPAGFGTRIPGFLRRLETTEAVPEAAVEDVVVPGVPVHEVEASTSPWTLSPQPVGLGSRGAIDAHVRRV